VLPARHAGLAPIRHRRAPGPPTLPSRRGAEEIRKPARADVTVVEDNDLLRLRREPRKRAPCQTGDGSPESGRLAVQIGSYEVLAARSRMRQDRFGIPSGKMSPSGKISGRRSAISSLGA